MTMQLFAPLPVHVEAALRASIDRFGVLRRTADQSRSVRGERSSTYITAILIKAWNSYRAGEKISILRYRPGGANPDRFPEPR